MRDDLRIALSVANITEATRETGEDYASQFGSLKPRALADCIVTLAAEVRRLRAAVEAVRALRFDLDGGYDDECGVSRAHCSDGAYLDADDVLAILEPKP